MTTVGAGETGLASDTSALLPQGVSTIHPFGWRASTGSANPRGVRTAEAAGTVTGGAATVDGGSGGGASVGGGTVGTSARSSGTRADTEPQATQVRRQRATNSCRTPPVNRPRAWLRPRA